MRLQIMLLLAAAWAPQAARGHAGGGFSSPFRRNHTADCTVAPLVNGTARTAFSCSAPGCVAKANNAAHNRRCRAHWWDKAACLAEAGDICDMQSEALRNPPYSKAADVDGNPCRPANGALPDNKWLANAGGNLTLTVLAMRNLPDADGFGALGGLTDAYVRASIGTATRESSHVAESLNPDWRSSKRAMDGRDMRFGPRLSGRRLHVQVYDRDGGLELGDDYLGDIETSVAFCSRFTAQDAYVHHCPGLDEGYCTPPERGGNCFWDQQAQRCTYAADADAPFNSAVAMKGAQQQPRLHVCAEEAWLLLRPPAGQRAGWDPTWSCAQAAVSGALPAPGAPYDKSKPTCVLLKQTIVPFDMQVSKQYAMTSPSKLVGVGIANPGIAAADSPFGNAVPAALAAALGGALEPRWQHMGCDWADGAHFGDFNFGRPWDDVSQRLGTASGRTVANGLYGALVVRAPVDHKEEWGCNPSNLLSGSLDTTCAGYCLDYLLCNLANCSAITRRPECEQSHYVEIAVNAPAQLTIFRLYEDNFAADGVTRLPMHNPAWMADWTDPDMLKPPQSKRASIDGDAATTLYKGWVKDFATTSLDVNGVVQDNSGIKLGFNRPRPPSKVPSTMYFVLATMKEHDDSVAVPCSKAFDRAAFFRSFAQFGVTFFAFLLLWWRFMQRIEFRLDRVESFLVEQKMVPLQQRNIVAAAFAMYNDCPQNRDFRRNLYYATRVVWVLAATPFVILWTWGASMMATVQPVTVGFGAITVGTAALLTTYATMHWRYSGYRIDRSQLALYVASFLLVFAFLGGIVFLDACARSFFSITALFMALNMLPMIWLAFTNDVVLRKSLKQLVSVVSSKKKRNFLKKKVNILGSLGLKLGLASGLVGHKGGGGHARSQDDIPESPFHDLTGDCYTVVGSMPTFKYADVMTSAFAARPALRRKRNKQLYALALALLAGYGIVCAQSGLGEKASALAWAVVVTCVVTDSVIYLLRRGNLTWTPGYTCLLMGASRAALVAFGSSDYWLLGMSIVLFIFGIAICAQIVNKRLPRISPMDAGQVVFFGRKLAVKAVHDMTATPEFALGYLSFLFVFLLLAAAFVQPANMPLPIISVMGQNWPVWVFAAIAFLSMLTFGLAEGTTRAFYLMEKHLLTPRQASLYLWSPAMRLPFVLAIAAEVMVVCSGLFVYGATGSSFVVTTAVFAPIIAALTMMVYVQWTKNDYALVRWPPVVELVSDSDDDDEDGDDILGKGAGGGAADLFALPPMRKGAAGGAAPMITMPSLPLKSTLRKKAEDDEAAKEVAAAAKEARALAAAAGVDLEGEAEEAKKKGDWRQQRPAWRQKHWFADFLLRFSWSLVPDVLAPHLLRGGAAAARVLCAPCRKVGQARKSRARIHATPGDDASKPSFGDALALGGGEGEGGDTAVGVAAMGGVNADEAGFAGVSVLQAFCEGYLLDEDYYTLGAVGGLLAAVNLYGVLVALVETPYWAGHALWVGVYVVLLTVGPLIKYFHSYRVTADMKGALALGLCILVGAAVAMFQIEMGGDANDPRAFQVLALVCLYPTFLAWGALWYRWYDDGWELSRMVVLGFPLVYASLTVWLALLYFWAPTFVFTSALLLLLLTLLVKWFLKAWVDHEFYLSPWYAACGANIMKFTALGAVVLGVVFGVDLFYCLSLAFFFVILHKLLLVAARQVTRPKGAPLFFSPYIFPVYSYEPCTDKLVEENDQVQNLYLAMFYALCWGVVSAMFVEPVGIGAAVCAAVLVLMATVTCVLGSVTPVKMGQAARCVDAPMLREAGQQAQDVFAHRRLELDIVCPEFAEKAEQEAAYEAELELLTSGGGAAGGPDAGAGGDAMLSRIEDAFKGGGQKKTTATMTHAMAVRKSAATLAWEIEDDQWKVKFEEDAEGKEVRRFDGLMTWRDAFADAVRGGHGPLGFLALGGLPYKLLHFVHRFWCKQAEAHSLYDADGARKQVDMRPLTDTRKHLLDLIRHDRELAAEYAEEMRCIVHFQMLVLVCSEAKLHRESTLFQKFLRENRFKLMSNGINPPRDIFRTHSFASIDISLVAVWLLSLTPEERERFHELKAHFTEEMGVRDMLVDEEDEARREEAAATRARFKRREDIMCRRRFQDFQARRERRVELGIEPAELIAGGGGGGGGGGKKKVDEAMVNAEEALLEIDSGWSCRPGSHGRALQFNDPDFAPDGESIGNAAAARKVVGWRQANAIATGAGLFADGTDPDDVHQGHVQDGWLMSAISIVAASGGVDDGKVDALIDSMFITKTTSLTGAYALRFWVNGQWETVIVDDFFPTLDNKHREEDCNGAFSSYSKGFTELWVPLIEKALAKYYGSYAALEAGHVQLALTRLTGGESEEIYLAHESRGAKKAMLWDNMLAWKRNQFLLGAGTVTADTADHEAQDTGLVFGATYVVYEVRVVDGYQLVKLRNPPGDHPEWKGDWGDNSRLWTRRLKAKLGYSKDSADNTFWMSFDDFCNAFRSLFVCRYYEPHRWPLRTLHGAWQEELAAGVPSAFNPDCLLDHNPQYTLSIARPTELCITLSQVDAEGLAPPEVHPIVLFVVAHKAKDRAMRVTHLDTSNVVASSGDAARTREVKCYCTLQPRVYTILCATYVKGMEGPFALSLQSNFPIKVEQLWPAPWKDDDEPKTVVEKMTKKAKEKAAKSMKKVKAKAGEKLGELKDKHGDKIEKVREALKSDVDRELDAEKAAEEAARQKAIDECPWAKQWDANAGKFYYYNCDTGMSVWDEPPDFVEGHHDEKLDAATSIQAQFRGKKARKKNKPEKKVANNPCSICLEDTVRGEGTAEPLLHCAGGCGAKVHPTCGGFSELNPPPDPFLCPLCET